MGLRDGLSEFGAIGIDVNPGQVVTALPSEGNVGRPSVSRMLQTGSQGDNRIWVLGNSHIDLVKYNNCIY